MSYSPALGRFLQVDPEEYVDGPNPYQADRSDPVGLVDPLGNQASSPATGPATGPATRPVAVGKLQYEDTAPPEGENGSNGDFNWYIKWTVLSDTKDVVTGIKDARGNVIAGYIIQKITVEAKIWDKNGNLIQPDKDKGYETGFNPAKQYPRWEAFPILSGHQRTLVGERTGIDDTWHVDGFTTAVKGEITFTGVANYYPDLTLPADFKVAPNSPSAQLPSTMTDPKLGETGYAVERKIVVTWDACHGNGKNTVKVTESKGKAK